MIDNIDYTLIDWPGHDFYCIKLITSEWAGVIYAYGKVSLKETETDELLIDFNYKVFEDIGKDTNTKEFKDHIGKVLTSIIDNESTRHTDTNPQSANPR